MSLRVRQTLGQLTAAVRTIHHAGKLHCDLKPSNVRVTDSGRVVVLDYGLVWAGESRAHAASYASLPESVSSVRGTPEYMAPELCAGADPTSASDVYALGVML